MNKEKQAQTQCLTILGGVVLGLMVLLGVLNFLI